MKKGSFLIFLLSLFFHFSSAQSKQQLIANYFRKLTDAGQFNGSVLVAEKNKIIYENSFGYADLEKKQPISFSTRFSLASISKTIVATAIMQLAQQGRLAVDAPVAQYLPGFPYPGILIRHLLSHSSGLPPYNAYFNSLHAADPTTIFTNADFLKVVAQKKEPLIYTPGEKQNYDNVNYIVLALLVEKLTGIPHTDYIQKHILKPAGSSMQSLGNKIQLTDPTYSNFAYPYLQPNLYSDSMVKASSVSYIVDYWSAFDFSGFGQYVATVFDLYKYAQAYRSGKLLNSATKNRMFQPVKLNNGTNGKFGLGWEVSADTSLGKIIFHGGNSTGLSCVLLQNITRDQVIIVFDNIHNNNSLPTAFALLNILNGRPAPEVRSSIAWIYGKALLADGPVKARETLLRLKKDSSKYYLSEDEINLLGYDFLGGPNKPNPYKFADKPMLKEAIETLKLNTELFPSSWNVYDSYGQALLAGGFKKEAIEMYKKSVELNPGNKGGQEILEKLLGAN